MADADTFGWYGLGSMGINMALNLQKHLAEKKLPPLHYSNRTISRGQPLRDAGAIPENDIENVVQNANFIFTMISDDAVLRDLVSKVVDRGVPLKGKVWVDTSTVHPETCAEVSEILSRKGATFIASPVFGTSQVASAGGLIFAMAGPPNVLDRLRPYIVDVMGRKIINTGEDVRTSSMLKISGNIFVIGFQELVAEGLVFAEKTGVGTQQMEQFIGSMFGPVMETYSKRMTSGAYAPPLDTPPGFAVSLAVKDTKHAISIAKSYGTQVPTVETALSRLIKAREYAGESLDSSSIYGTARVEAGLPFWSENSRQGN